MRGLLLVLLILLVLLQYKLWLGEGGFTDVKRLEQKVLEQEQENALLEQRNLELQAEVADLREGVEAIEERARSELGMVKEEEEFFLVVPHDGENSDSNAGPNDAPKDDPLENRNAEPNDSQSQGARPDDAN